MRTWSVTVEHIKKTYPFAVEILEFMSLVDYENTSMDLLSRLKTVDDIELLENMGTLLMYSMASELKKQTTGDGHTYRLHRLVAFATRSHMEAEYKQQLTGRGLLMLHDMRSSLSYRVDSNRPFGTLAAHTKAILPHYTRDTFNNPHEYWCLMATIAGYLQREVNAEEALEFYLQVIPSMRWQDVPGMLLGLARGYRRRGREDMYTRVSETALQITNKILDKNPTVKIYTLMAMWFLDNSCYSMASRFCRKGLEVGDAKGDSRDLGYVLGMIYLNKKDFTRSLQWLRIYIPNFEEIDPRKMPLGYATALEAIGTLYLTTRPTDYAKAVRYLNFATVGYLTAHGCCRRELLHAAFKLSWALHQIGNYEAEENVLRRAHHAAMSSYGKEHPWTNNVEQHMFWNREAREGRCKFPF